MAIVGNSGMSEKRWVFLFHLNVSADHGIIRVTKKFVKKVSIWPLESFSLID